MIPEGAISIKRLNAQRKCFIDWDSLPTHSITRLQNCLECGRPTMQLFYQENERYLFYCWHCGKYHITRAASETMAKAIYNDVNRDMYDLMKHTLGLDCNIKPFRNYYTIPAHIKPATAFNFLVKCGLMREKSRNENYINYILTEAGYEFMGFDKNEKKLRY